MDHTEMIFRYKRFLKRVNYSKETIKNYIHVVTGFDKWLDIPFVDVIQACMACAQCRLSETGHVVSHSLSLRFAASLCCCAASLGFAASLLGHACPFRFAVAPRFASVLRRFASPLRFAVQHDLVYWRLPEYDLRTKTRRTSLPELMQKAHWLLRRW